MPSPARVGEPSGTGSTKPRGAKGHSAYNRRLVQAGRKHAEQEPSRPAPAQGSARTGKPEADMAAGIDKREGALLRLMSSELKLAAIYQNENLVAARGIKVGSLRAVLRESIILNLNNFLQARKDLMSDPHYQALDGHLEPLIQPILDVETPIKKIRDRHIGHIQDRGRPFKSHIQDIVDKHMLDMHHGYWLFLARSAASYAMFIQANYEDVMTEAERKYDEKLPLPLRYGHGNSARYRNAHVNAVNEAARPLQSHGYEATPREARSPLARRRQK